MIACMSQTVSMDLRVRWSARSVVLTKWLTEGVVRHGDEVCELNVDGARQVVRANLPMVPPTDYGGVFRVCVREGDEVGPLGELLWVSTSASGSTHPRDAELLATARMKLARRAAYPPIFISYRRTDTDAAAGRLHEALVSRHGEDALFLDQFSIRPGEVWPWTIQQAVTHCKLVIVLVGPQWLTVQDSSGRRRISERSDFVLREVCAALDRGTALIPVLVSGAQIPMRDQLPADLGGLDQLQFQELGTRHWASDLASLVAEIDRQLA